VELNLAAAKAKFPDRGRAIDELASRDDDFRTMCVDLADAEAAALRNEESPSPKREQFLAEYRDLITYLTAEIELALDAAGVVALADRRSK
jgi:hypothetical protein